MDSINLGLVDVKKRRDPFRSPLDNSVNTNTDDPGIFKQVGRGLAKFMQAFGKGVTNTPIDMAQPNRGWETGLGGTIGSGLLNRVVGGGVQSPFYNTEPEQSAQKMVLQKAVQMKMLENQIEQDKLRKFLETNPGAKVKSARIGDTTYENPDGFSSAIEDLDMSKLSEEEKVKTFQSLIKKYPDINIPKLKSYFWPKLATIKTEDMNIF